MLIFKLIKEKIKLFKKTKEEKLDLLLSGENTPFEVSSIPKYEILGLIFFSPIISFLLSFSILFIASVVFVIFGSELGGYIPLNILSLTLVIIPFISYALLKSWNDKKEPLCNLFENIKLSYLTKNAKKINSYLLKTSGATKVHKSIFIEHSNSDEYYDFLCADIENVDILFCSLKNSFSLVFNRFYEIRKTLIEKKDHLSLETLDTIYNNKFLNDDLERYIRRGRSDFDKDIFDYLNIYGCRTDLYNHFKNKNSTVKPDNLVSNKTTINKNTIEINLLNQKEKTYANF